MNKSKDRLGGKNLLKIVKHGNTKEKNGKFSILKQQENAIGKKIYDEIKTRA